MAHLFVLWATCSHVDLTSTLLIWTAKFLDLPPIDSILDNVTLSCSTCLACPETIMIVAGCKEIFQNPVTFLCHAQQSSACCMLNLYEMIGVIPMDLS